MSSRRYDDSYKRGSTEQYYSSPEESKQAYYSKPRCDSRDDEYHRSSKSHSPPLGKVESPEKAFHLTMHQALLVWKAEIEQEHARELANLRRTMEHEKIRAIERVEEDRRTMEQEKIRAIERVEEDRRTMEQEKLRAIERVEEEKYRAIEKVKRQGEAERAEIERLKKEVVQLKSGWTKEREQWQLTKKSLDKDLDPFDFLGCN